VRSIRCYVKDPFPGISHWLGVGLSIAGMVLLLILAAGRVWHVVGFAIYGGSLILLYLASALAHTIHCSPKADDRFTQFDYIAIFLLIAGTYTPLCLVSLRGPWGWGMLSAEWSMAAVGIIMVLRGRGKSDWPRTLLYLFMAWVVAMIGMVPICRALPRQALEWLLAGGIAYSIGAVIFATDRPALFPGKFVAHDLWHLLVLAGSGCHFFVIFRFIAMA
jgi:hemolysin III